MSKAIPAEAFDHGDPKRYRRGCRCPLCTTAATNESSRNRYFRQTGRSPLRASDRAADHLARVRAAGMSDQEIKRDADLCPDVFYRVLRREGTIHYTTERRILAIKIPAQPLDRGSAYVDNLGTRRRLQALGADGWPATELGRRTGKAKQYVTYLQLGHGTGKIRQRVASEFRNLYAELAGRRPEDNGVPDGIAKLARQRAASLGWHGTDWWDDYRIDDPAAGPDAALAATARNELAALRREEVEHLANFAIPEDDIVRRVGLATSTVQQLIREWRSDTRRDRKKTSTAA